MTIKRAAALTVLVGGGVLVWAAIILWGTGGGLLAAGLFLIGAGASNL